MIAKAVSASVTDTPVVFRKKPRCPGYNPRMLNLGLGRHRHWGSSDDAKEELRLKAIDSFPIHTGKNLRSYHGPQRPCTTSLVALPYVPCSPHSGCGHLLAVFRPRTLFPSQAPALVRILRNVLSLSLLLTPCRSLLRCHHFRQALLGCSFLNIGLHPSLSLFFLLSTLSTPDTTFISLSGLYQCLENGRSLINMYRTYINEWMRM